MSGSFDPQDLSQWLLIVASLLLSAGIVKKVHLG